MSQSDVTYIQSPVIDERKDDALEEAIQTAAVESKVVKRKIEVDIFDKFDKVVKEISDPYEQMRLWEWYKRDGRYGYLAAVSRSVQLAESLAKKCDDAGNLLPFVADPSQPRWERKNRLTASQGILDEIVKSEEDMRNKFLEHLDGFVELLGHLPSGPDVDYMRQVFNDSTRKFLPFWQDIKVEGERLRTWLQKALDNFDIQAMLEECVNHATDQYVLCAKYLHRYAQFVDDPK